jgi:hypothetical protein
MSSLKNYCGPLSELLGMTLDGLYERARALTHSGYLSGAAGRGPGSGVRVTVPNVTKLLLSTLATDSLSDVDAKTRKLAALKQVDGKCPITGELRLLDALEKILASPDLSTSIVEISVAREVPSAFLWYAGSSLPNMSGASEFGRRLTRNLVGRQITAALDGQSIGMISADLRDIAAGAPLHSRRHVSPQITLHPPKYKTE